MRALGSTPVHTDNRSFGQWVWDISQSAGRPRLGTGAHCTGARLCRRRALYVVRCCTGRDQQPRKMPNNRQPETNASPIL